MTQHRQRVPAGKGLHVWARLERCARVSVSVSVRMGVGGGSGAVLSAQVAIKASRQETAPDPPVLVQICLLHVITSYANLEVMRLRLEQVLSDGPTICPSHPPRLGAFGERLMPAVTFRAGVRPPRGYARTQKWPRARVWYREPGKAEKDGVWDDLCSRGSAALSLWSWISHSVPSLPVNRKAPLMDRSETATFGKVDERSSIKSEELGGTHAITENNRTKGERVLNMRLTLSRWCIRSSFHSWIRISQTCESGD